jgi:catechol-2,3-dioxygenase
MTGKIGAIVLDTPDVRGLSAFYSTVAGVAEVHAGDDWVTTTTPEGWKIAFQLAPDHVPPRWPDQAYPQQFHLDLVVPDRDKAVAAAIEAGATQLPGGGDTWTTLADPSGHPFCLCFADGIDHVQLAGVCLDCPDASALARFYAAMLGMAVTYEGEGIASVSGEGQPTVNFQQVDDYTAPRWPDPAYPQQFHIDVDVEDVDAAEQEVLALGAVKVRDGDGNFRVYTDPAGHPFCLCW